MNKFEITKTLVTCPCFVVFEAFLKKRQLLVVMKRRELADDGETEFIKSALTSAKNKAYLQPLLSTLAGMGPATKEYLIMFVGRKGSALDVEVELDHVSQFPSGNGGNGRSKQIYTLPHTEEPLGTAQCFVLSQEVVRKVAKKLQIADLSLTFNDALVYTECIQSNLCALPDFRLRQDSKSVMERLTLYLAAEIEKRKSQKYSETELLGILQSATAGLLQAKSLDAARRGNKPRSILRDLATPKLSEFGTTGLENEALSPEARNTLGHPDLLQLLESDVFALGMMLLHLASLKLPLSTRRMSGRELDALLQGEVHALSYSAEFKQQLAAMLAVAPLDRPSLESVTQACARLSKEHAHALWKQGCSNYRKRNYAKAAEMYEAAHAIYSRLPNDKDTADTLWNWGNALDDMGRRKDAVAKYAAAHAIYSCIPSDKDTADTLWSWGNSLSKMGEREDAAQKYAAAHSIYSRLPMEKDTADCLCNWGVVLRQIGRKEDAAEKYAAAHSIFSRLSNERDTALNLYNWGNSLNEMGRNEEAVEKYEAAHATYSQLPNYKFVALNLMNWGIALNQLGRKEEAVAKYAEAQVIFSRFSNDKDTAMNLYNWGNSLSEMGKYEEAAAKYIAAHNIHTRHSTGKEAADNLWNWGNTLRQTGKLEEAAAKYAEAHAIFSQLSNDKDTANILCNWGATLNEMGKNEDAVAKYAAADAIHSRFPSDKSAANNLYNWGFALEQMERKAQAVAQFEAARAVYASLGESTDAEECDLKITQLS